MKSPSQSSTGARPFFLLLAGLFFGLGACSDDPTNPDTDDPDDDVVPTKVSLAAELVVSGIPNPVFLTSPAGDDRLFVIEREGRIRVVKDDALLAVPFLDLSDIVSTGNERGLLSMAFHPGYASNGHFYVNFTDEDGDTRVVRYTVSAAADVAAPSSGTLILQVDQPFANHNGGHILFGPDGMLYIAMGDGGGANDPDDEGQNTGSLLGALLRIDVDGGSPYAIPATNPFVGDATGRPEIWAWGLRNPWRISFDTPSGMLYVADVGQNRWEEVNAVPTSEAGLNYGWSVMEGPECFGTETCDKTGLVLPVLSYRIGTEGCAVIGGHVYRGSAIPGIVGHYFYSDFCTGWLRSFRLSGGAAVDKKEWPVGDLGRIVSMGVDSDGELYLLSQSGSGSVYRLVNDPD